MYNPAAILNGEKKQHHCLHVYICILGMAYLDKQLPSKIINSRGLAHVRVYGYEIRFHWNDTDQTNEVQPLVIIEGKNLWSESGTYSM